MSVSDNGVYQVKPFVVLSSQRSGSTFIRIWLNCHSMIHSYGEVFLPHYEAADGFKAYCNKSILSKSIFSLMNARISSLLHLKINSRRLVNEYLDALVFGSLHPAPWIDIAHRINDPKPREPKPLVGFKIMYNTLEQIPTVTEWINCHNPKVIHLTRNNLLRKYISMERLKKTRLDHCENSQIERNKIYIDVDKFIDYANREKLLRRKFREMFLPATDYMEICYEKFFSEHEMMKEEILNFLNVEKEEMPFHKMKKIGATNIADDVANWDEVVVRLYGTCFSDYLT